MTFILSSPYLYLLAGMFVYLLIDFGTFKRSIDLNYAQSFDQYISLNWYWLITGVLTGLIIVSMKDIGKLIFLNDIGFNITKSPESAFLIGLLNQWILIKLRKFLFPTKTETEYDKVITMKK